MGNSVKGTRRIVQAENDVNVPTNKTIQTSVEEDNRRKQLEPTNNENDGVKDSSTRDQESNSASRNSKQYATDDDTGKSQISAEATGNATRNNTNIAKSSDKIKSDSQIKHRSNSENQQSRLNRGNASFQKDATVNTNTAGKEERTTRQARPTPVSSNRDGSRQENNSKQIKAPLNDNGKKDESHIARNETQMFKNTRESGLGEATNSDNKDKRVRQEKISETEIKTSTLKSNLNGTGKTEKFSNARSVDDWNKKTSTKWTQKRALSEPVPSKNVQSTLESTLGILHEVQMDGKTDPRNAQYRDQFIKPESTDRTKDDEEQEFETGSSLRSTTLDSRLFESESSILTHTRFSFDHQKPVNRYIENKEKLKQGLLDLYRSNNFTTPEFSLLPTSDESTEAHRYWPPWMTVKRQIEIEDDLELVDDSNDIDTVDMNDYEIQENINQFHNLFHHEGGDIKNVYIVGESGTGKTAFCRHLIQQWCVQHQRKMGTTGSEEPLYSGLGTNSGAGEHDISTKRKTFSDSQGHIKLERTALENSNRPKNRTPDLNVNSFSDSDELDKFEFLFYIPLFFKTNHDHIHDLIKAQFKSILNGMSPLEENWEETKSDPQKKSQFINELLDKEPEKCLIVLDGLDVWRPSKGRNKAQEQIYRLPDKDPSKSYTVIITSTLENLRAIGIEATNVDLEVTLNGIEENTSYDLICDAADRLNTLYGKKKKPDDMITKMSYWKRTNYQTLPFILQSLVCLWFHSGAIGNTLCDIFSRILELLFKRFNDGVTDTAGKIRKKNVPIFTMQLNAADNEVKLPRYYINLSNCQKSKGLISVLGQIAWITRNQSIKSFDSSSLEVHGFSRDDISLLIKVGVLTQNKVPGFSEELHSKTVSFPDERIQDFFAATYVTLLCRNTAYENIGHINLHTGNIRSVVDAHFDFFDSLENILQFSNLITLLCGLYPPIIEQITQKIIDVVSADKRVLEFRNDLETESEENVCEDIQQLISRCVHESISVNADKIDLHIGDIFYGNIDTDHLKYVEPDEVKSVLIDADDMSGNFPHASKFIHQTRIFNRLQKLLVKDETSQLSLQDIDSIHILSESCAPTLNAVSYIFNKTNRITYLKVTQDLNRLLPKMSNLLELELKGIQLSHNEFCSLAWILSELNRLKRIQLSDITCEMERCDGEGHKMNFSEYYSLEHIDIDGMELSVVGVNKNKLVTCILGNLPQGPEIQIFHSLQKAKCLKHFTQKVRRRPSFISQTLIKTLNTWHRLETLNLHGVNFGENELILKKQMESLTNIRLVETRLSRIAWRYFVDCLPRLAQEIVVVTRDIHVTPLEEDVTRDSLRRPIDAETRAVILAKETERQAAFDYVRGKANAFCVLLDMKDMFDFEKRQK